MSAYVWAIASIPFWACGAVLVISGWWAPFHRRPSETTGDLIDQWALANFVGGLLLLFAAWVCS